MNGLRPYAMVNGRAWKFTTADGTEYQIVHLNGSEVIRSYFKWSEQWHHALTWDLGARGARIVAREMHRSILEARQTAESERLGSGAD